MTLPLPNGSLGSKKTHKIPMSYSNDRILDRLLLFSDPNANSDSHPIHGLHPYPAKYIPQLPREILIEHTNERHTVLDPFCGSGTTIVESTLLGRKSIGIDSNPIACLASKVKTTALTSGEIGQARKFLKSVSDQSPDKLPEVAEIFIDRQEHWFQKNMARELLWLKGQILKRKPARLRNFLLCVLSSIVITASRQDSETRFKAVEKNQPDGYALGRFSQRLKQAISVVDDFSSLDKVRKNTPKVILASTDNVSAKRVADNSVDLVVTSPPYPNSFDYYLYHKLRMALLGYDYRKVQLAEIGSRYEHSSRKAPIDVFVSRMRPVLANIRRMLKPSKLAYFFVGDSILAGKHIQMDELYVKIAKDVGLGFVGQTKYDLASVSRSFKDTREVAASHSQHKKLQRVLVFESTNSKPFIQETSRAKAIPKAFLPTQDVYQVNTPGMTVALQSNENDRHVHSLVWFPSKFIPEIPRWAIEEYSSKTERVLDPFGGAGTTAVEAVLLGRESITVDINPYACLATRAKTTFCDPEVVVRAGKRLSRAISSPNRLPKTERMKFSLDSFWFNTGHLEEFARILAFIDREIPEQLKLFFRVTLATTIRRFSYQDESQIKVKRDPKKLVEGTESPRELMARRIPIAIGRLLDFMSRLKSQPKAESYCLSIADWIEKKPLDKVDLIVTSPPYINAMNYPMATRYEMLLLGLVKPTNLRQHEMDYFGTERVYAEQYNHVHQLPHYCRGSDYLNSRLTEIFEREPKRSYIVFKYFSEMRQTLCALAEILRPGGRFVLVAGSNTIKGIHIDTFSVLLGFLRDAGLSQEIQFNYQIIKQKFKITRHPTGAIIPHDSVAVMVKK